MAIQLSGLHPQVRAAAEWCLRVAEYYGVKVTVTSAYRSTAHQKQLYDQYRNCVNKGIFGTPACPTRWPANPPGQSAHEYRLAWDSVVQPQYQSWWNRVREMAGFRIPPNDAIHAEVPNWRQYV